MTRDERLHTLIHAHATAAAGVAAGLAQVPGSDAPVLVSIQTALIQSIGHVLDAPVDAVLAQNLALTLGATMAGRTLSQWVVGWVPGWGNAVNAATAFALTEAVGWAAVAWLAQGDAGRRRAR